MLAFEEDILSLAPYDDEETYRAALERVLESPVLPPIVAAHFPKLVMPEFVALVRTLRNADEFQQRIIAPAIKSLLKRTSGGLTCSGMERLDRSRQHLFLSNHRDIICDTALFCFGLWLHGLRTPAFCLGDNLLGNPWVRDMIKLNKGITVKRGLSPRELLRWSTTLSTFIARRIEGGESVWLAQREGRAKDGDDRTQPGVLKMLTLGNEEGSVEMLDRLEALKPVPVAISYELDPGDALKARELWMTARDGKYEKVPGEDQRSMMAGVQGFKGRIHISVTGEIPEAFAEAKKQKGRKEQIAALGAAVDRRLHKEYRLWPSHYVAYDVVTGGNVMREKYKEEERAEFLERMHTQLATVAKTEEDRKILQPFFLGQYANPVRNRLALGAPL